MRIWNKIKNVMLSLTITMLYANWSIKELHKCDIVLMWIILVAVAIITFLLLREMDKQIMNMVLIERSKQKQIMRRSIFWKAV